ncbi:acetyltransferase (GNAT) family protein [Stackebrandtia albiflava]|uniref:Acetyltransferase (GNAT) family protein n=1 Tax=Stackebrandtia albiflava TaxID=406432 RepID=A0A562UYE5_9ACTN|nr:GNAT family N-acetyltransferase [Stackebrandtia albiflava]TWJ10660.1 acetyltransferase (GNAT) family protein [Stackebrandtia albiflava]
MSHIEITALDPMDQAQVDAWLAMRERIRAQDIPDFPPSSPAPSIVRLTRTTRATRVEQLLAVRDGRPVGTVEVMYSQLDNRHLVEFELEVDPAARRTGVGAALLAEVERRAVADGRTTLITYVMQQLPDGPERADHGERFALATGFTAGLDEIRRRADLSVADQPGLDRMLAEAWERAEGYELVQWVSRAPDDLVDAVAYLDGRLLSDSPTGDLDMEPQKVDAARIREMEDVRLTAGQLSLNTGVRHVATGVLAGWTDIIVNPVSETHCWQGITIVDPDHRGHRIGTILKIENHRFVTSYRPRMRYVHTWNAEENDYMININEAVGYRAQERWVAFQKKLTA